MPGGRVDPIISNRFYMTIKGVDSIGSLQEVGGLEDESEVSELQQVGKGGKIAQMKTLGANPLKPGTLTVKYATFKDDPGKKWYDEVVANKVNEIRRLVTIDLYENAKEAPTLTFSFDNAWPSKYSFSSFTAKGNDAVIVTLTVQHEGMSVKGYNQA